MIDIRNTNLLYVSSLPWYNIQELFQIKQIQTQLVNQDMRRPHWN